MHELKLTYNHYDELTRLTDPLVYSTKRSYDRAGNLVSETDARDLTEYYDYDGENRVIGRVDRSGQRWSVVYDALGYKLKEIDGNGRLTEYDIGAFGHTQGQSISGGAIPYRQGQTSYVESEQLDWLGRKIGVTDNYGKHVVYRYDDADRLRGIDDLATGQQSEYLYNAAGQRTEELLRVDGALVREQSLSYNERGWLTGIDTRIDYSDAGVNLEQAVNIRYRYDALGNRVETNANPYRYDGNNRMVTAYNDGSDQAIESIVYDGFGNRLSVTTAAGTVSYSYDLNNRLIKGVRLD